MKCRLIKYVRSHSCPEFGVTMSPRTAKQTQRAWHVGSLNASESEYKIVTTGFCPAVIYETSSSVHMNVRPRKLANDLH
jgi:hypothetical protein